VFLLITCSCELDFCAFQHLIRVTNVAALPDGGKKLFDKVAEIERDIAAWDSLPAETLAQLQKG
jgi:hypothetical protein